MMIRTITIFNMTTMIIMMVTTMVIMMIVIFSSPFSRGLAGGRRLDMLCLYQQFMTGHDLFVLTINISLNNNYCHDGFLAFFIKVQFKEKIQIKNTQLFKPGLHKQSLFVSQVSSLASVFPALRNFPRRLFFATRCAFKDPTFLEIFMFFMF